MTIEEFLRTYKVRAQNLMWLLGAGASAAAGIPTAESLIWEFKRNLFCAAQRISIKSCEDISSPAVRQRLNNYFENLGTFPTHGSDDEYAVYFEGTYPDPSDRRAILESYLAGAQPSFGHTVLAALMQMGKVRIIWTPNFDKLIEDAAVQILGSTSSFVVASLDNAETALHALDEGRWPIIGKLHGDFQSRHLKNTADELRSQDARLRHALVESCRRYGLIVVGYSGRDDSVMAALEDGIHAGQGYPSGLFWFHRADSSVLPSVERLIKKAQKAGCRADLLEAQTFDELLGDMIAQFEQIPTALAEKLDRHALRLSEIPVARPGLGWPVVRLNALPLTTWPTTCRLIVCNIGGTKEVRKAVADAGGRAIAIRSSGGVLAFGPDAEIRKAFSRFQITDFNCHSIEPKRLRYDSAEMGLLREGLVRAIERERPLIGVKATNSYILRPDFLRASSIDLAPLKEISREIRGVVPKTEIEWCEAIRVKASYELNRLWLLIEPTIYLSDVSTDKNRYIAASFVRDKLATRYNKQWNAFIEAWLTILMGDFSERQFRAFDTDEGFSAGFTLNRITAFSRRAVAPR